MIAVVNWLAAALSSAFLWLVQVFGKKVAITAAGIAAWLVIAGALLASLNAALNPLVQSMPAGAFASAVSMLPGNTTQCISAVVATHAACFLFETANRMINIKLQA